MRSVLPASLPGFQSEHEFLFVVAVVIEVEKLER